MSAVSSAAPAGGVTGAVGATVSDVLIGISRAHPARVAVDSPSGQLTFRELVARASQMARLLAQSGVAAGSRVGIACRRNEEILLHMCALWMLGAVAVPMDFRTRAVERQTVCRDFGLHSILEDRAMPNDTPYPAITVDAAWLDKSRSLPPDAIYSPNDGTPALMALTSGTSGQRVGAVIGHGHLLMRIQLPAGLGARDAGGRMLNLSPLSFCASIHNTLTQLWNAGTVVYFPVLFSAQEVDDALLNRNITSMFTVPTVVRGLLEIQGARTSPAYPQLRYLYCSGAPFGAHEKRLARQILSEQFIEIYASTFTGRLTLLDSGEVDAHAESVGRVLPQVNLEIVDGRHQPVNAGGAGAIRVRGPGTTFELAGQGLERQRGDRVLDGWVYTGDIGRIDAQGFLHLLGRDSEMIIRGGENVYPAEIESVALQLPGVVEAVALGFESKLVGEEMAVFVVAAPGVDAKALQAHFRSRLTPAKTPSVIEFIGAVPRNENGKPAYVELRRMLAQKAGSGNEPA